MLNDKTEACFDYYSLLLVLNLYYYRSDVPQTFNNQTKRETCLVSEDWGLILSTMESSSTSKVSWRSLVSGLDSDYKIVLTLVVAFHVNENYDRELPKEESEKENPDGLRGAKRRLEIDIDWLWQQVSRVTTLADGNFKSVENFVFLKWPSFRRKVKLFLLASSYLRT